MYSKYCKLRDKKGLTDYQVAHKANIPESTFYDWKYRSRENPKTKLSLSHTSRIAKVLGVPIEYFID